MLFYVSGGIISSLYDNQSYYSAWWIYVATFLPTYCGTIFETIVSNIVPQYVVDTVHRSAYHPNSSVITTTYM